MPRRVLHAVRSDAFAGVERYICDAALELARRGWDVEVVGGDPARMECELGPTVPHHPAASTADVCRALRRAGRSSIVHAHMTSAEVAAIASLPWTRARLVGTRHFGDPRGSRPLPRLALRAVPRVLRAEIAISRFVAAEIGGTPRVLHNGVAVQPDVDPDAREPMVLLVQRLEPEKRTQDALAAWSRSGLSARGWELVIAGDGSQREALQAHGVPGVRWLGFVDPRPWWARASIFVATAPREPFGLSVVEAMAAGMAVVASDGGAHRETLGDAGRLVAAHDVPALASALAALADDPLERRRLGGLARARQRSLLTVAHHVDGLEAVYAHVLAG